MNHPRPTNEQIEDEKARLRELLNNEPALSKLVPSRACRIRWVLAELEGPSENAAKTEMSEEHWDLVVLTSDWLQGWTRTRPSEVFENETNQQRKVNEQ